jgi:hypothetical protein
MTANTFNWNGRGQLHVSMGQLALKAHFFGKQGQSKKRAD